MLDGAAHYYGVYETADDKHVAVGAMEPQFYAELCQRLGVDVPQDENEPTAWAAHRAVLAARFREKTRAEWERQLDSPGCCAAPVLSLTEAPQHPHNVARGTFIEIDGVVQPAPAPRFSRTMPSTPTGPALPGDHTREVLADLGHGRRRDHRASRLPGSRGRVATEHRRKDDRWRGTSQPTPNGRSNSAWVDQFVRSECEPIDLIVKESHDLNDPVRQALIPPLQQIVKERGLWATHLGPHLGGPGYGQVKLALLNEILGRSECAPIVFGSQAPDSGNSEILAHYGTPELKQRYLEPLLDNRIVSCFSMTEPQGGADPKVFTTTAVQDGDHWVINGEKWFSSFASMASFIIVMAMTDPEAPPYERYSMFVVPGDTPGINVLRDVGLGYQPLGGGGREGYVRYENVRVPDDHMLGPRGGAFVVAQTRLGGGRIHHAMRTVGLVRRIFDMICERAVSRYTQGEMLSNKQLVQEMVADSWCGRLPVPTRRCTSKNPCTSSTMRSKCRVL